MDLNHYQVRISELTTKGLPPSEVVRAVFQEFGEISTGFLIELFANAYNVPCGAISYLFAGWWPDAIDSISDEEFNNRLQQEVERARI